MAVVTLKLCGSSASFHHFACVLSATSRRPQRKVHILSWNSSDGEALVRAVGASVVADGLGLRALPMYASLTGFLSSVLKSPMRILMCRVPPSSSSACRNTSSSSSVECPMLLGKWMLTTWILTVLRVVEWVALMVQVLRRS